MANLKILKDKEQKFFKEKFEDILFLNTTILSQISWFNKRKTRKN